MSWTIQQNFVIIIERKELKHSFLNKVKSHNWPSYFTKIWNKAPTCLYKLGLPWNSKPNSYILFNRISSGSREYLHFNMLTYICSTVSDLSWFAFLNWMLCFSFGREETEKNTSNKLGFYLCIYASWLHGLNAFFRFNQAPHIYEPFENL